MPATIILPATGWACDDCRDDYRAGLPVWREVSADFYEQMRDVLPPLPLGQGLPGFMVGEPFTHDRAGIAIHLTLVPAGAAPRRYFARYLGQDQVWVAVFELAQLVPDPATEAI